MGKKARYCRGQYKVKYANTTEAQPKIDEVYKKSCLRLYTYWCTYCKAVHLSKHAAPKGNFMWR